MLTLLQQVQVLCCCIRQAEVEKRLRQQGTPIRPEPMARPGLPRRYVSAKKILSSPRVPSFINREGVGMSSFGGKKAGRADVRQRES